MKVIRFILAFGIALLGGSTAVLGARKVKAILAFNPDHEYRKGDRVAVLRHLDFTTGNWKAIVRIGLDEWNLMPEQRRASGCWVLQDRARLMQMQRDWVFVVSGGDSGTVTSGVWFVQDGVTRWTSAFTLSAPAGLQNRVMGWARPTDAAIVDRIFKDFTPRKSGDPELTVDGQSFTCGIRPWVAMPPPPRSSS